MNTDNKYCNRKGRHGVFALFCALKASTACGGGGRVFLYRDVWNGKEKRLINTVGAHPCVRPRATARVAPTMKLIGFNVVTGLAPVIKADVCSRPAG